MSKQSEINTPEALREASSEEYRQRIELVQQALTKASALESPCVYVHVTSITPTHVVASKNGRFWEYPYAIDDSNQVTLSPPIEVLVKHEPVRMVEAASGSAFIEAIATEKGKPARYLVTVIKAGVSLNRVDYPASVLREAVPLFDKVRVFAKSDSEHLKGGGKDMRQLVGRLVKPKFVEAGTGGEIRAEFEVLESHHIAATLREAVERDMTEMFGLSIDAEGTSKTKGALREAVRITKVASVDLIVEPGAGGRLIRFAEALNEEEDMLRDKMIEAIRAVSPARADALASASEEQVLTAYREAVSSSAPPVPAAVAGTSAAPVGAVSAADLATAIRMTEARAEARVRIAQSNLPEQTRARLSTQFTEAADFTVEQVDAAIASERTYIQSLRESAPIRGLGAIEMGATGHENAQTMLEDFFTGKAGGPRSFREAYVQLTGDVNVTGLLAQSDLNRLAEAAATMREAVSAATFSNLLGNSITRVMQKLYRENPRYQDWRELCDIVPVRDFRTQERVRVGGYGDLPAVAENAPYVALSTPGDEKATYAVSKRGGIETVSLEAIANDDVGYLRRIPQSLATAAGRTLYEFVLNFMSANPVIYDAVVLFHATHANLGTAALSAASYSAARLRMQKQTELSSGKRLGLTPRHVYVPPDLEEAAYDLFILGTNNEATFVQSQKPMPHVVPHWTDANNWFVTADKADALLLEIGFFGGNEEPELFVQDNPTQGSLFSNDQIVYKVRHTYGGAVRDYRGFDGSIVA